MSSCGKIKIKNKRYCIGDMKHRCLILDRVNSYTNNTRSNSSEKFNTLYTTKCAIKTTRGIDYIDGIGVLDESTHLIVIRYIPDFRTRYWIEVNNDYYEVKNIENENEENRFLLLKCVKKGSKTYKANQK